MSANVAARRLLVGLAVTFLVAGCAAEATPSTPAAAAATTSGAGATPPQGPPQTPGAMPPPSPLVLDPSTAHWTKLDVVGGSGALLGLDGGYVLLGSLPYADPPGSQPAAFFSADGVSWEGTPLAKTVPNCADRGVAGVDVPDAEVRAMATNGSEVVVVGEEVPHDAAGCANVATSVRPVAWHSADGHTWLRSEPFEVGGTNSRATAVWATSAGWQAAVEGAVTGTISIWESTDGRAWSQVAGSGAVDDVSVYAGSAPDGTVVLARSVGTTPGLRLFTSRDGRAWEAIPAAGGCEVGTTLIVGPAAQGLDAWVLLDGMRLCTSPDLLTWTGTTMTDALSTVAQTRFGAIALGDACFGADSSCVPDPRAHLTADGVTWTPIARPPVYWGQALADGPAGVLLIGQATADSGETTAWRLDP